MLSASSKWPPFLASLGFLMEGVMNTRASVNSSLDIIALGWGLSAALVVLFVICLAVALVLPEWRASHGWIGLFSVAPMTSARVWIDGIVFSIVFGWVTGVVLGLVYNRLIRR
jgi:hypothetical protein